MRQPPGYPSPDSPSSVCLLKKTLYSLKQSGCHWYQCLCEIMSTISLTHCDVDMAVFYRHGNNGELAIVLMHVDDCTIVATSEQLVSEIKAGIAKQVEITDLGKLHWLLGIEICCNCSCCSLALSQHSFLESIIHRYGFEDLKPISIPMDVNIHLQPPNHPPPLPNMLKCRTFPTMRPLDRLCMQPSLPGPTLPIPSKPSHISRPILAPCIGKL